MNPVEWLEQDYAVLLELDNRHEIAPDVHLVIAPNACDPGLIGHRRGGGGGVMMTLKDDDTEYRNMYFRTCWDGLSDGGAQPEVESHP